MMISGGVSSREQEEAGRRQQELARQFQEVDHHSNAHDDAVDDDHDGDG